MTKIIPIVADENRKVAITPLRSQNKVRIEFAEEVKKLELPADQANLLCSTIQRAIQILEK